MAGMNFDITGDNSNFLRKLDETRRGVSEASKFVESQGKRIDSAFNSVSFGDTLKKQIHEGSQSVNGLTAQIIKQKAVIKDIEHDVRNLGEAYRKAGTGTAKGNALFADFKSAKSSLQEEKTGLFDLQTQQAQARLSVRKLKDEYSLYQKGSQDVIDSNNNMALSFKKTLAAIGGTAMIQKFVSDVIRVRGEFQQLDVAFTTLLQSKEKADALMGQIVQTAAKTPFNLTELATGAKQLVAYGFASEGVNDTLIRLGNIASGLGLPLERLTYLYGTTMTQGRLYARDMMQFTTSGIPMLQGLADMYGVSTAKVNEMVTAGKIGFPEVQKVIENMTNEGGKFFNLMEEQSKTITGRISNLGDAWDTMLNQIGESQEGVINGSIDGLKYLIENYETVGKILMGLIGIYGTYRTAAMLVTAVHSLQAAGISALTTKEAIHYAWLVATKKAQLALNATMLTNPYVLLATAGVGTVAAMWALHDSTTAAEKAQDSYNKKVEDAAQKAQDHKQKLEGLISELQNEVTAETRKMEILDEIKKGYPSLFQKFIDEKGHVKDLTAAWKAFNEEASKNKAIQNKTNASDLKQSIDDMKRIQEVFNKYGYDFKSYTKNDLSLYQKYKPYEDGNLKENIEKSERELWKWEKEVRDDGFTQWKVDLKGKTDEQIKAIREAMVNRSKAAKGDKNLLSALGKRIIAIDDESNSRKPTNETKDKSYWENLKKETQSQLDALSDVEASGKKGLALKQKITGYENKINKAFSTNTSKQDKTADKLRQEQEKYNLLLDKQALDQSRSAEDLQTQVDQARINAMDEGSKKTIAQMELNFEKEMQTIDRQKEDLLRKKIEDERAAFDTAEDKEKAKNPKHVKQTFDPTGITLSDGENKQFDSLYKAQIAEKEKEEKAYLDSLLEKHQDYTNQRLAIEKKFNADIAALDEQRAAAVKNGDTQQVEQIDRAKAQATTNKGKELMGMDYDKLKESPEYVRAFENLKETSSETLNSLLSQLENAKGTAAQVLSPDQLREYTTTIQEVMDELDSRNPFQALSDKKKELAEAENELAEAKRNLDKVNAGGKVASGTKLNEKTGKTDTTYLSATQALLNYNKAKDKAVKADAKLVKAEKESLEVVEKLADSFKDIGDSIGGTTGEIIGMMGDITSFVTLCMTGMSNVSKTASAQIQAVEKASIILGIISAAIQLMQKLSSILPTADSQYEKYAAKLEEINKLTDAINEYKIAALEAQHAEEGWFSEDNLKNLRNYKELHDQVTESYKDKASESQAIYHNKGGGGWFTNSWNWILDNTYGKIYGIDFARQYEEGQTAAMDNLRIETRSRKKGFLGSGIGGRSQKTEDLVSWAKNNGFGELFDEKGMINKESANAILNQYGDKLVGQTKETLESLVKLREKYDEYIQQLHEYVSTLYEPLVDNFVDGIWDWLDSGKNALDSFKEYASDTFRDIVSDMMKTIALEKIFNNEDVWGKGESYQSKVSKVYEDYASGLIDEVELNKRVSELTQKMLSNAEAQLPAIQGVGENILDTIYKTTGIDLKKPESESTTQDSTNGGFQTMSQDEGKELNGRFTAFQISNEEIKNSMLSMLVSMNLISVSTNTNGITLMEIKNIALMSNSHLEDIAKYTKELIGFKQTIANIETSAKAMAGK